MKKRKILMIVITVSAFIFGLSLSLNEKVTARTY